MNEVMETIRRRRSVRSYEPRPVERELIEAVIGAANEAPSGCNTQGWRFVVVENEDFRRRLLDCARPECERWLDEKAPPQLQGMRQKMADSADPIFYGAPVVVFVIGTGGLTGDFDVPMVCQNMMLAARSLGLGSCWVYFGQFALEDAAVREALELKEGEKVYGPILLGWPAGGKWPEGPEKRPAVVKWV